MRGLKRDPVSPPLVVLSELRTDGLNLPLLGRVKGQLIVCLWWLTVSVWTLSQYTWEGKKEEEKRAFTLSFCQFRSPTVLSTLVDQNHPNSQLHSFVSFPSSSVSFPPPSPLTQLFAPCSHIKEIAAIGLFPGNAPGILPAGCPTPPHLPGGEREESGERQRQRAESERGERRVPQLNVS